MANGETGGPSFVAAVWQSGETGGPSFVAAVWQTVRQEVHPLLRQYGKAVKQEVLPLSRLYGKPVKSISHFLNKLRARLSKACHPFSSLFYTPRIYYHNGICIFFEDMLPYIILGSEINRHYDLTGSHDRHVLLLIVGN